MANLSPKDQIRWYRARERASDVTCVSDCYEWESHWDVDAKRTRRCGGPDCLLCAEGNPVVRRYVFFVRCEMGIVWALELRDGQRRAVDLANVGGTCLGAVLRLRLEGRALDAAFIDRTPGTVERSVERFGESLGLPAVRLAINGTPDGRRSLVDRFAEKGLVIFIKHV